MSPGRSADAAAKIDGDAITVTGGITTGGDAGARVPVTTIIAGSAGAIGVGEGRATWLAT